MWYTGRKYIKESGTMVHLNPKLAKGISRISVSVIQRTSTTSRDQNVDNGYNGLTAYRENS
jgi:hypothetical protein